MKADHIKAQSIMVEEFSRMEGLLKEFLLLEPRITRVIIHALDVETAMILADFKIKVILALED